MMRVGDVIATLSLMKDTQWDKPLRATTPHGTYTFGVDHIERGDDGEVILRLVEIETV